ncbi:kappa-type opioid receptor-like [Gigantopelta aegis]|uniref:kappa-type opioid receptor-like n=1 Tax=Gigantopelta aegis TaxID=1735272 RepID=UPI001B88DDBE|nr:kappa-type opioid receptor-like [Gigantopelta aegis]
MSLLSTFSLNQTSTFTTTDNALDNLTNGSYFDYGSGDFKHYFDYGSGDFKTYFVGPSTDFHWPYFNLNGYGHWAIVLAIAIIGTIGNILQFIMMSDSKLSSLSYSVYLKFLAVSDSLVLAENLWSNTQEEFHLPKFSNINDALCKIFVIFGFFTMMLSPWLVVGLTLDRFVCVRFPLTRGRFCTMKKAITVCSSMIAATIVLCFPSLVLSNFKYNKCLLSDEFTYYFMFIRLVMSSLLPCIVILTLNIVIIVSIKRSNAFRNTFIKNRADSMKDNSSRPLVLISVLAFITLMPIATSNAIAVPLSIFLETGQKVAALSATLWPAFHIVYLLNFAQNFFILMVSSQTYREIMKRKLRCFCGRRKQTRQNAPASGAAAAPPPPPPPTTCSTDNTDDISLAVVTCNTTRSETSVP